MSTSYSNGSYSAQYSNASAGGNASQSTIYRDANGPTYGYSSTTHNNVTVVDYRDKSRQQAQEPRSYDRTTERYHR